MSSAQLEASTVNNTSCLSGGLNIDMLRGRDGRDGQNGRDGRDGLPGALGPTGPQGESGEAGGPPGPQGEIGARGPPGLQGAVGPSSGGVTYTRWGKSSCPNVTNTELVYGGRAGGSDHTHNGGGANFLCMPSDPEYTLTHQAGVRGHGYVYGVEYIKTHYKVLMITTFPVPFATSQHVRQS